MAAGDVADGAAVAAHELPQQLAGVTTFAGAGLLACRIALAHHVAQCGERCGVAAWLVVVFESLLSYVPWHICCCSAVLCCTVASMCITFCDFN